MLIIIQRSILLMISLTIKDIKQFMNKLLISDTFDGFCVSEADIATGCTYSVNGRINSSFFTSEEISSMPSSVYITWKAIRPFAFSIIKGSRVPEFLKITFAMPDNIVSEIIENNSLNYDPETINGLFLNIKYSNDTVTMTTASSLSIFTLDHSLDEAFEKYIISFLIESDISYEE